MKMLPQWSAEAALAAAQDILPGEWSLDGNRAYHRCPGCDRHTSRDGVKDFALFLTGKVPAAHCVHTSCYHEVVEFNKDLWRRVLGTGRRVSELAWVESDFRRVKEVIKKRQDFDLGALKREQIPGLEVTPAWLAERSPVDPRGVDATGFLERMYEPGERVLVFTSQFSQGDYGYVVGEEGGWRELFDSRALKAVPMGYEVPHEVRSAREGVWFLAQPVDGLWHLEPDRRDKRTGGPMYSRRSHLAVTAWRWMVLESDCAPVALWLNFLAGLKMKIGALYTSGGRSVHALLRVDCASKGEWDAMRDMVSPVLSKLGGDAASITAVRLTRLPGCFREGKMRKETFEDSLGQQKSRSVYQRFPKPLLQELLWLDPNPTGEGLVNLPVVRSV